MLDVEPETRERLAGRAFALRDLVFVVREDEVDATAVDVDRVAEQTPRHGRALDVPAGAPGTDTVVPRRLSRAWWPSTARSRARSPCRTCRCRCARPAECPCGPAARACRTRATWRSGSRPTPRCGTCGHADRARRSDRTSRGGSVRRWRGGSRRPARGRWRTASSRNAAMYWSVYSRRGMPAFCDSTMVRSSTSVKFITWWTS